ncbi:hypothetical protein B0T18DRAFT_395689, partial [Schizothecium vesticola]
MRGHNSLAGGNRGEARVRRDGEKPARASSDTCAHVGDTGAQYRHGFRSGNRFFD